MNAWDKQVIENTAKYAADRYEVAVNRFVESAAEQFGKNREDALKVLRVFMALKIVKIRPFQSQYELRHGAYWCQEAFDNAANYDESTLPKSRKKK